MGFYLRRAVSVGPLRFNLSGGGVGVSVGVKGFRLGAGPRGAYVHAGRGGLYYRQRLGGAPARSARSASARRPDPRDDTAIVHDSAPADQLMPATHADLLAEMATVRRRPLWLGWIAAFALSGVALLFVPALTHGVVSIGVAWWLGILCAGGVLVAAGAVLIPRGVAVVVYDLDGDAPAAWEAAWHAWHDLNAARALWNVEGLADPDDRRAHGDAERPTHRSRTRVIGRPPRWLRANTSLLSLGAGRQTLIPTPDALLVAEPGGAVGAVPWHAVRVDAFAERVREPGPVPADAEVVGTTWQHARKDGGRDRRFRDNPEIAICRYGVLHLHSASGLDERFHVSDPRRAEAVRDAIARLRAAIDPGRP